MHVAGGTWWNGRYLDTHAHDLDPVVLDLLAEIVGSDGPGVLLERDRVFDVATLRDELAQIGRSRGLAA